MYHCDSCKPWKNKGGFILKRLAMCNTKKLSIGLPAFQVIHRAAALLQPLKHSICRWPTDNRPEIPEPVPSLSRHGDPIEGYSGFSHDQNNRDSLSAYVLRSGRVWSVKTWIPQLELHGWQRHYTEWYSSGISLLYLWDDHRILWLERKRFWSFTFFQFVDLNCPALLYG